MNDLNRLKWFAVDHISGIMKTVTVGSLVGFIFIARELMKFDC